MNYFDITPTDLIGEILLYLDNPIDLINLDNIYPFNLVLSNYIFWINKFRYVFLNLNISHYDINNWDSPFDYKRLYKAYNDTNLLILNTMESQDYGTLLVFQKVENIPIIDPPDEYYDDFDIIYIRNENTFYQRFTMSAYYSLKMKYISLKDVINIITYMKYNRIPLDYRE